MRATFDDQAQDVAVLGRTHAVMGIPTNYFVITLMIAIPLATSYSFRPRAAAMARTVALIVSSVFTTPS